MNIHIGYILGFELGAFLLALAFPVIKWVRYYNNFANGWAVATTSEARGMIVLYFALFNILGAVGFIFWLMVVGFGIHFAW